MGERSTGRDMRSGEERSNLTDDDGVLDFTRSHVQHMDLLTLLLIKGFYIPYFKVVCVGANRLPSSFVLSQASNSARSSASHQRLSLDLKGRDRHTRPIRFF